MPKQNGLRELEYELGEIYYPSQDREFNDQELAELEEYEVALYRAWLAYKTKRNQLGKPIKWVRNNTGHWVRTFAN